VEQKYQLFQQQQFTFIAALEHCRENASDKIRPISSIGQGGSAAGAALETPARGLGRSTGVPGAGLSRPLLPPRRCPPDMANYLSCHEARNHCGGVVSLIPIVLDMMKEWVAHSEKLPRKALQHVEHPASAKKRQVWVTDTRQTQTYRGKTVFKTALETSWWETVTQLVTCLIPIPSCPIPSRGGATVKNKKRSATSLPGLVSWDLSLKENDIHPKTPEDAGQ
ncbi:hypothetical protein EI555_013353, partial [Monodon monoceros]